MGEGLGGPPRLQVPRHAHGRPHLGPVERVARSEQVLRAPSLSLGAGNRASPPRATGACLLPPPDSAPSRSFSDGADSSPAASSLSMALPHSPATGLCPINLATTVERRCLFSPQELSTNPRKYLLLDSLGHMLTPESITAVGGVRDLIG